MSGDPANYFERLKALVFQMPRTQVVTETGQYLHVVCRTSLGFRDDLEFRLSAEERVVHVRAASRLAPFWDFGVNRRRIEHLRQGIEVGETM